MVSHFIINDSLNFLELKKEISSKLENYKQEDNLFSYYNLIIKTHDHLRKSHTNSIRILDLTKRKTWRDPTTLKEKIILRKFYSYFGFYIKELQGDYSKSLNYYNQALFLDRQINDSTYHYYLHNPLANIYTRLGEHKKSIALFEECKSVLIKQNKIKKVLRVYPNLAIAYNELGQIENALKTCLLVTNNPSASSQSLINCHLLLAKIYCEKNEKKKTETELNSSFHFLQKLKKEIGSKNNFNYYYQRLSEYFKIKSIITFDNDLDKSKFYFNESINSLTKAYKNTNRREFGKVYISYGQSLLKSKKYQESINMVNQALINVIPKYDSLIISPLNSQLYPENTIQEALSLKGTAYELKYNLSNDIKDLKNANQCFNSALKVSRLLRDEYVFNDSKYIGLQENKDLIEASLENYLKLSKVENSESYLSAITELFQKSKSNILSEKRAYTFAVKQMTKHQKNNYKIINSKIDSLTKLETSNSEYISLLDQKKEFLDGLVNQTKRTKQIATNYVDYFVGENYVYAFVNSDEEKKLYQLGKTNDIKNLIKDYNSNLHTSIQSNKRNEFNIILNELYKSLVQPLGKLPYDLKIIPDEDLLQISFESLINDKGESLLDNHIISYHFEATENSNSQINSNSFAAIFSPSYEKPERRNIASLRDDLYEIVGATEECFTIEKIINSTLFEGTAANKKNFIEKIGNYNIVHFAGHAVLDSTEQSYLAFNSIEQIQNQLFLKELDTLNLDIDLLTLSACNTASGKIQPGEGTFSLARAFHGVGAESIISTLWEISDQTSSEIMISFYKNLKKGQAKNIALRNAKLEYLKNADPDYKHPYYWSGIIAMGDMSPVFLKTRNNYYYIIGLALILGLGLMLKIKRKKQI